MDAERRSVFDVVTDFLAQQPTDEALLAYTLPPDAQARHDELKSIAANSRLSAAQLHGEDELTAREREEVFAFVRADGFISLLKAKNHRRQPLGWL